MEDKCRIADLHYKEVIRVSTGERIGFVGDVELDLTRGSIISIVVPGSRRFLGLFGKKEDSVIPWDHIDRIGNDIILVK